MPSIAVADNFKLLLKSDEEYLDFLNKLVDPNVPPGFEFTIEGYSEPFCEWVGCTFVEDDGTAEDIDEDEEDMSTGYAETVYVGKDTDQIKFVKIPQVRPALYPCIVVVGGGEDSGARLTFVYPEDFRFAPQEVRLKGDREKEKARTWELLKNIRKLCLTQDVRLDRTYDVLLQTEPRPEDADFRKVERAIVTVMGPTWLNAEGLSKGTNRYMLVSRIKRLISDVRIGSIRPQELDKIFNVIEELSMLWGYSQYHPDNLRVDWPGAWDFGFEADKQEETKNEDEFPLIVVKQEE